MSFFSIHDPKAPLIGRSAIMQRLMNNFEKKNPSHLSIRGPRFSGKTVLLNALVKNMRRDKSSQFQVIVYWDLGNQTPVSDEDFLQTMCKKISEELCPINKEWSGYLLEGHTSEDPFNDLKEGIEFLESEKINILMLWDGFEKVLRDNKTTRNLWDNLRGLADSPNIRFIAASRDSLYDSLRDAKANISLFWNKFEEQRPILIPIFDEDDQNAVLEKLNGIQFKTGAKKELLNWTGGFPPLYLSVINQLLEMSLNQVDSTHVVNAAQNILKNKSIKPILDSLWNDCSVSTQELFTYLANLPMRGENDNLAAGTLQSDCSDDEKDQLTEKGLAKLVKNKIIINCQLMQEYVLDKKEPIGNVARLFKKNDDYQKNIKPVLEHRLNQIEHIDNHLKELIRSCIRDIPGHSKSCLRNMRGILDEGLDLILDREFQEMKIPEDWIDTWKRENPYLEMTNRWPSEDWEKLKLLQYMVGAYMRRKTPPKAKYTSLSSYYFLQNIKNFGDYSKHRNEENISVETSVTAVMTCIEFAASLGRYG